MIPVRINFPGQLNNAIAATQSITASAGGGVILNGSIAPPRNFAASATTASGSGNSQPVVIAGCARPVTIFATTSATNCIFTVIGQDLSGNTITATVIGASGGGATVTTPANLATTNGVDFHIVTGVVSSASVGNFTVGFGATGVTNWVVANSFISPFSMTVGGTLTATTTTFSVQDTPDNVQTATAPQAFTNATINAIATTSLESNYAFPVAAVRGIVTTNSATGGVAFFFAQAGGR